MAIAASKRAVKIRELEAGMIVKIGEQAFVVAGTTEQTASLYPIIPLGTIGAVRPDYERRVLRQQDLRRSKTTIEDSRLYAEKYEYVDSQMDVKVVGRN